MKVPDTSALVWDGWIVVHRGTGEQGKVIGSMRTNVYVQWDDPATSNSWIDKSKVSKIRRANA